MRRASSPHWYSRTSAYSMPGPVRRERYRAAAAEQRARLLADIRRAGASTLEVTTAEPLLPQLVTYLRRRQSRRGHALTEVPA